MKSSISESIPTFMRWEYVSSLVGANRTRCLVAYPESETDCRAAIEFCKRNDISLIARGGGFSYGDVILNDQNVILSTAKMNRIIDFDESTGLMRVQPGVRIIDVLRQGLYLDHTLAACPSESTITIAGAIGCNVNGKDAWRVGNFGDQVVALKLLTASGDVLTIDRSGNKDIFRAVVGGLGLIGIIIESTIQLRRISSPSLAISRTPVANIDQLLEHLKEVESGSDFAVVWIDTCSRGAAFGRAVVHATKWIERPCGEDELRQEVATSFERLQARVRQARKLGPITAIVVTAMLQVQRISVPFFNALYFNYSRLRHRLHTAHNVESFLRYNFDASFVVPSAAAVCGPRGYTIQVLIPRGDARAAVSEMINLCQASPCFPAKLIMRIHRHDDYLISFSGDGYSLNFEMHPKKRHVERMQQFVDDLIECVIRFGGKVHLAKDMVLSRDQFRRLFPRYVDFLQVKHQVDPNALFQSDMYRRLFEERSKSDACKSVHE